MLYTNYKAPIALFFLCTIIPLSSSPFSFITDLFNSYSHEKIDQTEIVLTSETNTIIVDHTLDGSLTVTGWPQQKIALKATKKAKKEDDLTCMRINTHTRKNGATVITTGYDSDEGAQKKCAMDLELLIPANAKLSLVGTEAIEVGDTHGPLSIITDTGDVTVYNIKSTLRAIVNEKGSIHVTNAKGNIHAVNTYGNITVEESYKSVIAKAEYGTVKLICTEIPSTSKIDLNAKNINLTLPEDTHATLAGNTVRGKIVSEVPIRLEPRTTVLNNETYKQLTKNVRGVIGEHGETEIKLSSARGIHIMQNELNI